MRAEMGSPGQVVHKRKIYLHITICRDVVLLFSRHVFVENGVVDPSSAQKRAALSFARLP
jgi:hypothetical protein